MRMSNMRNRWVYALWAPIYDAVTERFFAPGRRRAMEVIDLRAGERVCFVGVGTGTDLLSLPPGVYAAGVDLSHAMLDRAERKLPIAGCKVDLRYGDAQALPIADGIFDAAVLNLILSVVPDPARCLAEALRIVHPGGRVVVFDKFLPDGERPPLGWRLMNVFSTLFGTAINRRMGDMLAGQSCSVVSDNPACSAGYIAW